MNNNQLIDLVLEEIRTSVSGISEADIKCLLDALDMEKRIFCDGAGRSRLQIEGFAMRLTQMGFQSVVVGEATTPAITKDDILLICSGSGETPMLIEHAVKAKRKGSRVLAVTATKDSALYRLGDISLLIESSSKARYSKLSIQPMGSLFEQSVGILCDIMVLLLMNKYQVSNEEMYQNHSNLE